VARRRAGRPGAAAQSNPGPAVKVIDGTCEFAPVHTVLALNFHARCR
jgi:hypothetical protein